ncbi:hypothetical protein SKAU_G00148870 [Synaphobranchus kaupii]|uniref:Apoptosis-stimulating of p53 protein 2 n=1 Tax=Synaphobranchus kaupii TaxID=118154 RepID=A0A9Q1FTN3_SYNKA|nr:hypothetical protein SKAU_G00148870 [Synaphobranchus kaupii]
MRYGAKMMPMFLTVYLSNNDQHFTEVPVTPETLCRDVVELCKEPGETECYLAEMWRGSERVVGESERLLDVMQRWGQQRAEVRFFLRHERVPSRESGGSRAPEHLAKRNGVKGHVENGVAPPRMDMTLAELQEMASRQQQQIDAQQQLLASKEQRLRFLKQQEQRQQQQQRDGRGSEQEKLLRLRENAESQEAKLKKVRALRGQVEQKRLSNGKLVEEIEQISNLFQQKQKELVLAVSKVEDLSRQLEMLKNGNMDAFHDNQSSAAELDRLYKELQLRNKLNQEQNSKLQQQRENLNKRNLEVAAMDRRVSELRDRLWKKKAALQQKENLPNGFPVKDKSSKGTQQAPPDGHAPPAGRARSSGSCGALYPVFHHAPGAAQARSGAGPSGKLPSGAGLQTAKVSKFSEWSNSSMESGLTHGSSSTLPRMSSHSHAEPATHMQSQGKRTNLRKLGSERIAHAMRVKFNPLALLLDSSLEGEYDLVQRIIYEVEDPSLPNDEGITALHNAVCAGHTEIVKFLVQFGVNVNAADSDGWTPLHCAASCNNVQVCKFLVESGAAVFATTYSDMQTAADKCEEMEEGYAQCSQFLYGVQEKMGIMNRGVVYALWDYPKENEDELVFREGDCMTVVRREDQDEVEWWWARMGEAEGYIARNLLGLYPRIKQRQRSLA